jgi:hypothetical protein
MCPKSNKAYPNSKRAEQSGSQRSGSNLPPDDSPPLDATHQGGDPPQADLLQPQEEALCAVGTWSTTDISKQPQVIEIGENVPKNACSSFHLQLSFSFVGIAWVSHQQAVLLNAARDIQHSATFSSSSHLAMSGNHCVLYLHA